MHSTAGLADLAELRLDLMEEWDLPRLLAKRPLPVIITCRPVREGGQWQGTEAERRAVLRQAAELGAEYVDVEWDCADELARLDRSRSQVILSRHDFSGIPPDLADLASGLWSAGPDAVKVVGMARGLADIVPVLQLLRDAVRPTIAIAMGASGLLTRVVAFRYASALLSFAAPDPGIEGADVQPEEPRLVMQATAPGQVDLRTMLETYRVKRMTPRTRVLGLVAEDANSSPLLAIGNAWLAAQGVDAVLVPARPGSAEDPTKALDSLVDAASFEGWMQPTKQERARMAAYLPTISGPIVQEFPNLVDALAWLIGAAKGVPGDA